MGINQIIFKIQILTKAMTKFAKHASLKMKNKVVVCFIKTMSKLSCNLKKEICNPCYFTVGLLRTVFTNENSF